PPLQGGIVLRRTGRGRTRGFRTDIDREVPLPHRGTIAKLSVVIVSPSQQRAVGHECHGKIRTGGDSFHARSIDEPKGLDGETAVGRRSIAQRPKVISSPG